MSKEGAKLVEWEVTQVKSEGTTAHFGTLWSYFFRTVHRTAALMQSALEEHHLLRRNVNIEINPPYTYICPVD